MNYIILQFEFGVLFVTQDTTSTSKLLSIGFDLGSIFITWFPAELVSYLQERKTRVIDFK